MANLAGQIFKQAFSSMHNILIVPMDRMFRNTEAADLGTTTESALFLGELMATNAVISAVQTVDKLTPLPLEAALAEVLFYQGKYWYYKFLINPSNARFSDQKLQAEEETSDLTIINTYRNQATTLSISGNMGCTMPRKFLKFFDLDKALPEDTIAPYPKVSQAYLKFRQLEKFYKEVNEDILVLFDMDLYVGKFTSFGFAQDAANPWVINYDMAFKFYPGLQLHTLSAYDFAPFFNELVHRYGTPFAKDYEGKSLTDERT